MANYAIRASCIAVTTNSAQPVWLDSDSCNTRSSYDQLGIVKYYSVQTRHLLLSGWIQTPRTVGKIWLVQYRRKGSVQGFETVSFAPRAVVRRESCLFQCIKL